MPARLRRTSRFLLSARLSLFRRRNAKTALGPQRAWARAFALVTLAGLGALSVVPASAQSTAPPAASDGGLFAPKSAWDAPEPWRTDRFYIQTSVATVHFNSDPNHDNTQNLIYGEWRLPQRWLEGQVLVGASFFDNSFGQPSQFVFGGLLWRPAEQVPEFYIKVAAGVIHGYEGEFKNKIPYNNSGYAPGIVPAVGYCYNRFCGEMILFGTAGMLWTIGMTLP
jgi:hypothetical protein